MQTVPLKYLVSCNDEALSEKTKPDYEFDYIEIGSVEYGKGITSTEKMSFDKAPSRARRIVQKGDVIISTVRTYLKAVAYISECENNQIASTGFAVLRPKNIYDKFLYYSVLADDFIQKIEANSVGISYPAITATKLMTFRIPVLSFYEQQLIANYLDDRCSKIDAIIAEAKASIEEYRTLREATISGVTTRGIKSNRKFKPSGIEWLPQIPLEWNAISAKALFQQRKERALPNERQLTASQKRGIMYQDEYMLEEGVRIVVVEKDFNILKHVEPDDFVISMRSFQGGLEYSYLRGCISSAYVMLVPNHEYIYSEYYKWLFKSDKYINALQSTSDLIRDGQALRYGNFVKLRLFTVPITEQKEIAEYLNNRIPQIDEMISEKQSLIEDLESYKKSLIYEVVTGKRKVVE